ncbi:MAG TPA: DUF1573 domain-containing protein [Puia sp.]|nr:DUF1573 domain-containing protein [Puia sp.]
MKKAQIVLLSLLLLTLIVSCGQNDRKAQIAAMKLPKDSTQFTSITWLDSTDRHFGSIPEGRKLDVTFRFKNSGDKPLIISQVRPSCGCTIAEQPDEPVLPGKEGVIRANFNSEGRVGVNNKTLFVTANTRGSESSELHFSVVVEKKKW